MPSLEPPTPSPTNLGGSTSSEAFSLSSLVRGLQALVATNSDLAAVRATFPRAVFLLATAHGDLPSASAVGNARFASYCDGVPAMAVTVTNGVSGEG